MKIINNIRDPRKNYENHETFKIPSDNYNKIMKILALHARITKIMKVIELHGIIKKIIKIIEFQ